MRFSLLPVPALALYFIAAGEIKAQQDTEPLPSDNGNTNAAPASPDELARAIAAKEAEIAALKQQLEGAQKQIQNLSDQNKKLETSDTVLKTTIQNSPVPLTPARPAPGPLATTPNKAAPMDSQDLFWYFHNSQDVANQYLRGKDIAVNGKIVGFEPPILQSVFGLELASGDPNLRVICKFGIPPIYAAVFFKRRTGAIMGRTATGGEDVLLNLNDVITVTGRCSGLSGGDVTLGSCRLVE